jgi:hypothetical protein
MPISLYSKSPNRLDLEYTPNQLVSVLIPILVGMIAIFALLVSRNFGGFAVGIGLGIFAVYTLVNAQGITCSFDKNQQTFSYQRGKSETTFELGEIYAIETRRHASRHLDYFSISCVLKNAQQVMITGADLGFSDCQSYSRQIQEFLGPDIPVLAVD